MKTSGEPTLGQRLRAARLLAGYERARHFAEALGLKENTYCRYERDETTPSYDCLAKICELLNIQISELVPVASKTAANTSNETNSIGSKSNHSLGAADARQSGVDGTFAASMRSAAANVVPQTAPGFIDSQAICSLCAWRLSQILAARTETTDAPSANRLHRVTEYYFALKRDPHSALLPFLPHGTPRDQADDPELMNAISAFLDAYHANLRSSFDVD